MYKLWEALKEANIILLTAKYAIRHFHILCSMVHANKI